MAGLSEEQRRRLAEKSKASSGRDPVREQARYDGGRRARVEARSGVPLPVFVLIGVLAGIVVVMGILVFSRSSDGPAPSNATDVPSRVYDDPDLSDGDMPSKNHAGSIQENQNDLVPDDSAGDDPDPLDPDLPDVPSVVPTDLVHISIAAYANDMTQADASAYAVANGWYSAEVRDDGSVLYAMTVDQREAMRAELKAGIDDTAEAYAEHVATTHVIGIEPSEDYTVFRVRTDAMDGDDDPWTKAVASDLLHQAMMYRFYMGETNPMPSAEFVVENEDVQGGDPTVFRTLVLMGGTLS